MCKLNTYSLAGELKLTRPTSPLNEMRFKGVAHYTRLTSSFLKETSDCISLV